MKKLLTFIVGCLFAAGASADTASPKPFTVQQPDGTTLTLRMVGDEHFHYFVDTTNGRTLLQRNDGTYYYAEASEMQQFRANAKLRREAANERRITRLSARRATIGEHTVISPNGPKKAVGEFKGTLTGTRKGLVILVNFKGTNIAGLPSQMQTTREQWDRAFNEVGYHDNDAIGSVHDYFYDQSYGKFNLDFDVVGPVTVSNNLEYYGENGSGGDDKRAAYMVAEACKLANDLVNFADYDWDGDGEVDQVYVIYAGYGEATEGSNPNTIWPHEYHLTYTMANAYQPLKLDGVKIDTYACSNELCGTSGTKMNGIGTACHEFSHCIGYPDFYDTDYTGGWGMDTFDIMCSGGHNGPHYQCEVPCGYTSYERWMAGWLEPVELTEGRYIEDMKEIAEEPEAYIIYNDGNRDEYFLLENRQCKRWFSFNQYNAAHHGMYVIHVDYSKKAWTGNTPNTDPEHQRMTLVPAGNNYGTYYPSQQAWAMSKAIYATIPFPGTKKVRTFDNESHYEKGGKLWNVNSDGSYNLNKFLTEIAEDNVAGTISFKFTTGTDNGHRYMVKFEAGNGTVATASLTQGKQDERIVLPAAKPATDGSIFVGWTTAAVAETTTRPAHLMPAGTAYLPQQNVTLHAVYAYSNEGLRDVYRPVTTLKKGHKYVFANSNVATATDVVCLSTTGLNTEAFTKTNAPTPISFAEGTTDIVAPDESCTWMVQSFDDELVLYNGARYILFNNTEGMKFSDEVSYVGWDDNYGLYAVKSGSSTKYYLRLGSGAYTFSRSGSATSRFFAFEQDDLSDRDVIYSTTSPTGIDAIELPATANDAIYDLQGRRVNGNAISHGVSIVGSKKVVR